MQLDEHQFGFLYLLLEAREKGEYMPLSLIRSQMGDRPADERVVALSLENAGLVDCVSDDRLLGSARYKYKLTPQGYELIKDILRGPTPRVTHVVRKPKEPPPVPVRPDGPGQSGRP